MQQAPNVATDRGTLMESLSLLLRHRDGKYDPAFN